MNKNKLFLFFIIFFSLGCSEKELIVKTNPNIGILNIEEKDITSSWSYLTPLTELFMDKDIKAIILNMKVDYGSFYYSNAFTIANSIIQLKKIYKKPVIAYGEIWLAYSAYIIATSADYIMASPLCILGHMTYNLDYIDKSEQNIKDGLHITPIHAGKYKNQAREYLPISQEDLKVFQKNLNNNWQNIVNNLIQLRPILGEYKPEWVNGEIYIANKMKNNFFIDKIGDRLELLDFVLELINEKNLKKTDLKFVLKECVKDLEKSVINKDQKNILAIINLKDSLLWQSSENYFKIITEAFENPNVIGILFDINCYGANSWGTAYNLYTEIKKLKKVHNKTVIAYIGDYAYSGGYWFACCADHIIASPTSPIGSIGSIWHKYDYTRKDIRENINYNPLSSNELGNIFNDHKKLTQNEEALIQKMTNELNSGFIEHVKDARPMLINNENEWQEAQIYNAYDALKIGLIDEIGSPIDAIKRINKNEDLKSVQINFKLLNKLEPKDTK